GVAVDERLAAGDLDERRADLRDAVEDLLERHALAAVERVLGVAPHAAQRAAGQPHERAGQPRPGALALDGVDDLRDAEEIGGRRLLVHRGIEPRGVGNVPVPRPCPSTPGEGGGGPSTPPFHPDGGEGTAELRVWVGVSPPPPLPPGSPPFL